VILEPTKSCHSLATNFEGWYSIGDTLDCTREEFMKGFSETLESILLKRILDARDVRIDFIHRNTIIGATMKNQER